MTDYLTLSELYTNSTFKINEANSHSDIKMLTQVSRLLIKTPKYKEGRCISSTGNIRHSPLSHVSNLLKRGILGNSATCHVSAQAHIFAIRLNVPLTLISAGRPASSAQSVNQPAAARRKPATPQVDAAVTRKHERRSQSATSHRDGVRSISVS